MRREERRDETRHARNMAARRLGFSRRGAYIKARWPPPSLSTSKNSPGKSKTQAPQPTTQPLPSACRQHSNTQHPSTRSTPLEPSPVQSSPVQSSPSCPPTPPTPTPHLFSLLPATEAGHAAHSPPPQPRPFHSLLRALLPAQNTPCPTSDTDTDTDIDIDSKRAPAPSPKSPASPTDAQRLRTGAEMGRTGCDVAGTAADGGAGGGGWFWCRWWGLRGRYGVRGGK